jgi:hypothetical protein
MTSPKAKDLTPLIFQLRNFPKKSDKVQLRGTESSLKNIGRVTFDPSNLLDKYGSELVIKEKRVRLDV